MITKDRVAFQPHSSNGVEDAKITFWDPTSRGCRPLDRVEAPSTSSIQQPVRILVLGHLGWKLTGWTLKGFKLKPPANWRVLSHWNISILSILIFAKTSLLADEIDGDGMGSLTFLNPPTCYDLQTLGVHRTSLLAWDSRSGRWRPHS